ncbi:hypothetical protein Moror_16117 [Moniliophthora roreri MCA 2997]|uniref:Uncharacterized protein n=1 Tax=Moniliophthora roreri (strain MCA 2997) TaxID=1381753 RepID=V2WRG7_MONRO|nr:hypothetical protein Moror_16117 [Moniliophthora roreri MCA 2997]
MAAPTQEYPPWLTTVVSETTDDAGNVGLETSVMYLPLTYYGPPIPLGPNWTYGGLTSPASTETTLPPTTETTEMPTTTAIPSSLPTTTAIPTTTPPIPTSATSSLSTTSSLPSTSSSSLPSTSSSSLPSTSSSSLPPTATNTLGGSSISRGQLIGIIVGTVLGSVFLFITLLTLFLCWYRKRKRDQDPRYVFRDHTPPSPTESDYHFVSRSEVSMHGAAAPTGVRRSRVDEDREMGEGSPRHSGEEADPFLQSHNNTQSSKGSSSTGSGYGTVLPDKADDNPPSGPYAYAAIPPERRDRHILSKDELRRLDEEEEDEKAYNPYSSTHQAHPAPPSAYQDPFNRQPYPEPLMPPPRLVDPSRSSSRLSQHSGGSAVVLTAQRERIMRAEAPQVISSSPSQASSATVTGRRNSATGSGILGSLGLGGLGARILGSTSSRGSSRRNSYVPIDSEADRYTDVPPRMRERLGVGTPERPISSVSAKSGKSGETVYHSLPGTPLMPPSRALGHSSSSLSREFGVLPGAGGGGSASDTPTTERTQAPTAYEDTTLSSTATVPTSAGDVDILDLPAPRTVPSFSSLAQSTSTTDPEKEKQFPYPPGLLNMPAPGAWKDTAGTTPSPGSFAASVHSHAQYEDTPPRAPEDWAVLRRGVAPEMGGGQEGRRGTFGLNLAPSLHHPSQQYLHSEAASFHSHLSPSSGSGASSHKQDNSGSSSSRRTAHSHTLSHSGSISEDSQQSRSYRHRGPGTLSPFGVGSQSPRLSAVPEPPRENPYAPLSVRARTPPLLSGLAPTPPPAAVTNRRAGPGTINTENVPWAGGLSDNWSPT